MSTGGEEELVNPLAGLSEADASVLKTQIRDTSMAIARAQLSLIGQATIARARDPRYLAWVLAETIVASSCRMIGEMGEPKQSGAEVWRVLKSHLDKTVDEYDKLVDLEAAPTASKARN